MLILKLKPRNRGFFLIKKTTYDNFLEQLITQIADLGEKFRARQIYEWLWKKELNFNQMTNLTSR